MVQLVECHADNMISSHMLFFPLSSLPSFPQEGKEEQGEEKEGPDCGPYSVIHYVLFPNF